MAPNYLAGYGVECALACIAKQTERHEFPDEKKALQSYSHDLRSLAQVLPMDDPFIKALRRLYGKSNHVEGMILGGQSARKARRPWARAT